MPRDCSSPVAVEVTLPAGRRARIIAAERAGEVRLIVDGVVDRLVEDGTLTRAQCEAARYVGALFELAGVRQRLCSGYEPKVDADGDGFFLERLDGQQLRCWRRLSKVLGVVPPHCRSAVEAACLLDELPAGSIGRLRLGLDAVARAIRRPRR